MELGINNSCYENQSIYWKHYFNQGKSKGNRHLLYLSGIINKLNQSGFVGFPLQLGIPSTIIYVRVASSNPTDPFTILQLKNMLIDSSDLHKVRQSTDFEALKCEISAMLDPCCLDLIV